MIGKPFSRLSLFLAIAVLVVGSACNLPFMVANQVNTPASPVASQPTATGVPATEAPTTVPTVTHLITAGEPPSGFESQITDSDTSPVAAQRRAAGGENFNNNQYERPFDQSMDTYFPDLDIKNAGLKRDATWVYVTITLTGPAPQGGLPADYGVEVDTNLDGRGDFLVMASAPGAAWSTDGVRVWKDGDHNVGGFHPVQADQPPQTGNGYETLLFDQGQGSDPDLAWARINPGNPNSVQIAFKRSLINDSGKFLWGAWAVDPQMFHPDWFDYNDHFTQAEAGSPLTELTQYYPLKAFYAADDTCRWAVGFKPTGSEPGVCPVPPTPTPVLPGRIIGLVYYDFNVNGTYDNPPDSGIKNATIRVRSGTCGSPGGVVATAHTVGDGTYSVNVPAGTYCVDVNPDPSTISWNAKSPAVKVTVPNGGTATANFWYWFYLT
jgi:hypothetical protein